MSEVTVILVLFQIETLAAAVRVAAVVVPADVDTVDLSNAFVFAYYYSVVLFLFQ